MTPIRSERTVEVRLKGGKINLNNLIVLEVRVSREIVLEGLGEGSNLASSGGSQIITHALIVGEDGGGGSNFGTHVADGSHTSARDALNTWTKVFNNGTSSSLDGEDVSNLKDDVLRSSPSIKLTSELNSNDLIQS